MTKSVRVRLHHAADGCEPCAREGIIGGKAGEFVPIVVDGVDDALVGPRQRRFELKVIGRIGEDEIDAGVGQARQLFEAIADEDLV